VFYFCFISHKSALLGLLVASHLRNFRQPQYVQRSTKATLPESSVKVIEKRDVFISCLKVILQNFYGVYRQRIQQIIGLRTAIVL